MEFFMKLQSETHGMNDLEFLDLTGEYEISEELARHFNLTGDTSKLFLYYVKKYCCDVLGLDENCGLCDVPGLQRSTACARDMQALFSVYFRSPRNIEAFTCNEATAVPFYEGDAYLQLEPLDPPTDPDAKDCKVVDVCYRTFLDASAKSQEGTAMQTSNTNMMISWCHVPPTSNNTVVAAVIQSEVIKKKGQADAKGCLPDDVQDGLLGLQLRWRHGFKVVGADRSYYWVRLRRVGTIMDLEGWRKALKVQGHTSAFPSITCTLKRADIDDSNSHLNCERRLYSKHIADTDPQSNELARTIIPGKVSGFFRGPVEIKNSDPHDCHCIDKMHVSHEGGVSPFIMAFVVLSLMMHTVSFPIALLQQHDKH
jgi:hypothetical protein